MVSKAERKRRRKAQQPMPALAAVPKPKARGRARMAEKEIDIMANNLDARARCMGHTDPAKHRDEMRATAYGEAAGRALMVFVGGDTARDAYAAYSGLYAATRAYRRALTGTAGDAKCAKIETAPERFETRADDRPDLRTEEDKTRDATNTWMRWQGYLGHLAAAERVAITSHMDHDTRLMHAGRLTVRGKAFCAAAVKLAGVVK